MSAAQTTIRYVRTALFESVDAVRLDTFRRCFTLTFIVYMSASFMHAREWLTLRGFHCTGRTTNELIPDPFSLLSMNAVAGLAIVLFTSSLCVVIGLYTRLMTWIVFGCAVYVQGADLITAHAINKLYIVGFLLLALSPSPRVLVDERGKKKLLQSVWPIRVLQATLLIMYFTSGTSKLINQHKDLINSVGWRCQRDRENRNNN